MSHPHVHRYAPKVLLFLATASSFHAQGSTHVPCTPSTEAHVPCIGQSSSTPCADPPPANKAWVYRDENGVAHIEATTQKDAWRAMGYEEARDALYSIALQVKKTRGEHARFLTPGGYPYDDIAVKYFKLHLWDALGGNHARLRNLLKLNGTDQVYDNLSAYAEGVNAYRAHLRTGALNAQEVAYKSWLDSRDASWAYELGTGSEHQITVFDVASYVPWFNGTKQLEWAVQKDNNPHPLQMPSCVSHLAEEPPAPRTHIEELNTPAFLAGEVFGEAGSNSYYWMNNSASTPEYMELPFRGGHVSDPHQSFYSAFSQRGGFGSLNGGKIFAQIRVCNSGDPTQELDVFGWKVPGSGAFGSFFSRHVSIGGSAGEANTADAFLIQVNEEGTDYYSYYTGEMEPLGTYTLTLKVLPPGATDPDDAQDCTFDLKRAGPFGLVVNTQVFYAEAWTGFDDDDPRWNTGPNPVSKTRDEDTGLTLPVLVAYRTPYEPRLSLVNQVPIEADGVVPAGYPPSPARVLYRGAVGSHQLATASGIPAVRTIVASNETQEGPMFLAVDKNGRMFATNVGPIPRRGNDVELEDKGITVTGKLDLYDSGDGEPVPARWDGDRTFDWELESLTGLGVPSWYVGKPRYLSPTEDWGGDWDGPSGSPVPNQDYKSYAYFNPNNNTPSGDLCDREVVASLVNHPRQRPLDSTSWADGSYESPGFATLSNNEVYFAYKKDASIASLSGDPPAPPCLPAAAAPETCDVPWYGDQIATIHNRVLSNVLLTATAYSARAPGAVALLKNRDIIDFVASRKLVGDPMSCEEARSFAIDNRNYVPRDGYADYREASGSACIPRTYQAVPPAVGNLADLDDQRSAVIAEAERERRFFSDLWSYLHGVWNDDYYAHPTAGAVLLKDVWIDQTHLPFWYPALWDDATDCPKNIIGPAQPQAIDMPAEAALVDFLWSGSRLGAVELDDALDQLGDPGNLAYSAAVDTLLQWSPGNPGHGFRNGVESTGAALLFQYDLGFNAATNGASGEVSSEGRVWTPLFKGKVHAAEERFPDSGFYTACPAEDWLQGAPDAAGNLPTDWTFGTAFTYTSPCDSTVKSYQLMRYYQSYAWWRSNVFPGNPDGAVLYDFDGDCEASFKPSLESVHPIMRIPKPPYGAIYVDPDLPPAQLQPKTTLSDRDINTLVHFFLVELGGFTLQKGTGGSPSTTSKKERVDAWLARAQPTLAQNPYPASYPLTRNLARALLMQRLVEADEFNAANVAPVTTWGDIVRTRVYDFACNLVFPAGNPDGVPCSGAGIRGQQMYTDKPLGSCPTVSGELWDLGFQARIWAGGASDKTMLVLWSSNLLEYPETFFVHFPGTRQSGFVPGNPSQQSPHFAGMAQLYADRGLAPTHFTDYRCFESADPTFVELVDLEGGVLARYASPP